MMPDKRSVWVIEQGSHDEYRVVGVYSTQRNALLVATCLDGRDDPPEVREWALDPSVDDILAGRTTWQVVMAMDGTVERCAETKLSYLLGESAWWWIRPKAAGHAQDALVGRVWAKDVGHAVQIVNEERIRLLATHPCST